VPLKEFGAKAKDGDAEVGDEVEVYVERIENALGEAILSREKARREESWVRSKWLRTPTKKSRPDLQPGQGRLHRRSGRRRGLPAAQPGRHPSGARRHPADAHAAAVPDPQDGQAPRQHRGLAPHRSRRKPCRTAFGNRQNLEEGQTVEGMVKNITDYGAFVDLGGIDGLLHVTDMAWRRVNHPSEVLSIGQTVKVQIIRINQDTHRISWA
jgi:small subunit ribosomal protein S1